MRAKRHSVLLAIGTGAALVAGAVIPVQSATATSAATTPVITSVLDSIAGISGPQGIGVGADGNVWLTGGSANKVVKINTATHTAISYGVGSGSTPYDIAAGSDGYIYYTSNGNDRIGRLDSNGNGGEFTLPAGSGPRRIAQGPEESFVGYMWFTESANRIGKISQSGVVTEYTIGGTADPMDIAAGPDGNMWFTEPGLNRIGRITTSGVVTEFSIGLSSSAGLRGITAGPDGNMWFTELGGDRIGRITMGGEITEFSTGIVSGSLISGIAPGADGQLWFTSGAKRYVGSISTAGVVSTYPYVVFNYPSEITSGPDGAMWFLDYSNNGVWEISTTTGQPQFKNSTPLTILDSASADSYPSTVTVSGLAHRRITAVTAQLTGLSHTYSSDIDVLLVGPNGQKVVLLSDISSPSAGAAGITLRFSDRATAPLGAGTFVSGTFKPSDEDGSGGSDGDTFVAPAPTGPYGSKLSAFNGTDPNGQWSLYVVDDSLIDVGVFAGGWGLDFETEEIPAPVLTSTIAASATQVSVVGSSEAGSTVALFADAVCTIPLGSGNAVALAAGISVTVAANAVTNIYATSTDAATNVSACSASHVTIANASAVSLTTASTPYGVGAKVGVSVAGATGTVTVAGTTATLVGGAATVTLPPTLPVGSQSVTVAYSGDASHSAASVSVPVTIVKAEVKASVKTTKKPTSKKTGKATVTISSKSGGLAPSGKVTVTFTKSGQKAKKVTKSFSGGKASITVPKLAKGKWTVTVAVASNGSYNALKTTKAGSVSVSK